MVYDLACSSTEEPDILRGVQFLWRVVIKHLEMGAVPKESELLTLIVKKFVSCINSYYAENIKC